MKIFFDGGCRPNPGAMEVAVVARGQVYRRTGLGCGSSSEAEWAALLHALEIARALGETDIVLLGDSATIVRQANGEWTCRSAELRPYLARFREQATHFRRLRVRHIRRAQNLAGIALERARAYESESSKF